ncbi:hypothetical protein NE237_024079 [Protea cynaroides]|uniref:Uncharacterized protein n=1 Tax=Protea cynaroides TaxID=273540 RepID=A0A9Q0HE72_9MAGN|nr:hypothetical protein NE237_024079 [Protea cynaroides]
MMSMSQETGLSIDMNPETSSIVSSHEIGRRSFEDQEDPSTSGGPVDLDCLFFFFCLDFLCCSNFCASGSCRDGEDPGVNRVDGGHFDFSTTNGNELDSISLNFDYTDGVANEILPQVNADVIVLSDSEEENENLISTDTTYETVRAEPGGIPFFVPPHGVLDSYHDTVLRRWCY